MCRVSSCPFCHSVTKGTRQCWIYVLSVTIRPICVRDNFDFSVNWTSVRFECFAKKKNHSCDGSIVCQMRHFISSAINRIFPRTPQLRQSSRRAAKQTTSNRLYELWNGNIIIIDPRHTFTLLAPINLHLESSFVVDWNNWIVAIRWNNGTCTMACVAFTCLWRRHNIAQSADETRDMHGKFMKIKIVIYLWNWMKSWCSIFCTEFFRISSQNSCERFLAQNWQQTRE